MTEDKKIRKALKRLLEWTENHTGIYSIQVQPRRDNPEEVAKEREAAIKEARKALAIPMRNCDRFSANEQQSEFKKYCDSHSLEGGQCDIECPLHDIRGNWDCEFLWMNMKYKERSKK